MRDWVELISSTKRRTASLGHPPPTQQPAQASAQQSWMGSDLDALMQGSFKFKGQN